MTASSFPNQPIRHALLAAIFCVVSAVGIVNAKFALLTFSELHACWLGEEGHFPFTLLSWSEQHLGGDALAIRLPLLLILIGLLALVLIVVERLMRKQRLMVLLAGAVVLLGALAVQQYFALKRLQRAKRELSLLMIRVERASAPGEPVSANWNIALPLFAYGSKNLRQELRGETIDTTDVLPVPPLYELAGPPKVEFIFVGSLSEKFVKQLALEGYQFHENEMAPAADSINVARYYRAGTGIYFVSPPTADLNDAVSSKP